MTSITIPSTALQLPLIPQNAQLHVEIHDACVIADVLDCDGTDCPQVALLVLPDTAGGDTTWIMPSDTIDQDHFWALNDAIIGLPNTYMISGIQTWNAITNNNIEATSDPMQVLLGIG